MLKNFLEDLKGQELNDIDIACEVYLAKNFLKFTYEENWKYDYENAQNLPSKDSLVHWITDKDKKGAVSKYIEQNPEHFNNKEWQARFAMDAQKFVCRKLVDENYVSVERRQDFEAAFYHNKDWKNNIVGHIFNYLLRRLHKLDALQSKFVNEKAQKILEGNKCRKELYSTISDIEKSDKKDKIIEEAEDYIDYKISTPDLKTDYFDEFKKYKALKIAIDNYFAEEKHYLINDQMSITSLPQIAG